MSTQTIRRPTPSLAAQIPGKYLSLVTYKRDGTAVATPMWFVLDGDRLLVSTDARSAKVRRLRHNPQVTVAACRANGRVTGEAIAAEARILPPGDHARAKELMQRKYRLDLVLVLPIYNLVQRLRGRRLSGEEAVLAITPS